MIIVTTPSVAAQKVEARVADMGRKNYLRVVGVVENMSYLVTADGGHQAVFGSGGGESLAREIGAPLLGCIPLDPAVAEGSDIGEPAVLGDSAAAEALKSVALALSEEHVPPVEMAGCSAPDARSSRGRARRARRREHGRGRGLSPRWASAAHPPAGPKDQPAPRITQTPG